MKTTIASTFVLTLTAATGLAQGATLLVPNGVNGNGVDDVQKFDADTGASLGTFASSDDDFGADNGKGVLDGPSDIKVGPDNLVYVSYVEEFNGGDNGGVARFNQDGSFHDLFLDFDSSGSTVVDPSGLEFDDAGNLYVVDAKGPASVERYNTTTGVNNSTYTFSGSNATSSPRDIVRVGDRMVISAGSDEAFRSFDPATTDNESTVTSFNYSNFILGMTVDDSGGLYSISSSGSSGNNQNINLWEDPTTGNTTSSFATLTNPSTDGNHTAIGLLYYDGQLLVHDGRDGQIRVFDPSDGSELTPLVDNTSLLDRSAWGLAIIPEPASLALLGVGSLLILPGRRNRRG